MASPWAEGSPTALYAAALEMLEALGDLEVFALLRRVPCPLLVVRARRALPPVPGM
ncbi:hypothetical protein [Streptomyces sp. NPDC059256]|uniref:hypothetical protein n=1 Tax=Streptomyces sp. NPDC059256 TaxID=3346794 RepID=UPI0036C0B037